MRNRDFPHDDLLFCRFRFAQRTQLYTKTFCFQKCFISRYAVPSTVNIKKSTTPKQFTSSSSIRRLKICVQMRSMFCWSYSSVGSPHVYIPEVLKENGLSCRLPHPTLIPEEIPPNSRVLLRLSNVAQSFAFDTWSLTHPKISKLRVLFGQIKETLKSHLFRPSKSKTLLLSKINFVQQSNSDTSSEFFCEI